MSPRTRGTTSKSNTLAVRQLPLFTLNRVPFSLTSSVSGGLIYSLLFLLDFFELFFCGGGDDDRDGDDDDGDDDDVVAEGYHPVCV